MVKEYLASSKQGELIKQVKLNSKEYLLHATIVAVGVILATLYSPDAPYQFIRKQTRFLTTRMINPLLPLKEVPSLPDFSIVVSSDSTSTPIEKTVYQPSSSEMKGLGLLPRPARKFKRASKQVSGMRSNFRQGRILSKTKTAEGSALGPGQP